LIRLAAAALAAIALASAALGAAKIWPRLADERARWADATPAEAARAIWSESPLPPALFDFYRAQLRPGDRYWVQARPAPETSLEKPLLVRSYAAYWLLPAIQVRRLADATAVLSFRADPRALGVPLSATTRYPGNLRASVSRVAR
jgi:hypothetical protein